MQLAKHQNLEIRPTSFKQYIGQEKIKNTLKIMIGSSQIQNKVLPHILLYGAPGSGKTTLANVIAKESGMKIYYSQGSLFEKKATLLSVLTAIEENTILFIDEIHSLPKNIEEMLYSVMEDFVIDIVLGVDSNSKVVRMKVKPFTLIGATTKLEIISKPLRDRFGFLSKMVTYQLSDIKKIIKNNAKIIKIDLDEENINFIAEYSQLTPRIANNLLARIKDYVVFNNLENLNHKILMKIFDYLGLYEFGLNEEHLKYLQTLSESFKNKYVSLDVLAGLLNSSKESITQEIEPALLNFKLVNKTIRGRQLTQQGEKYLERNLSKQ
ncbi:Holliday junction branch migration DNA helicase RuvB [Mycoplasmopsis agassizii]|uniref:Holliday junction branch migration DNA helicase RuvB n=1 Tax=Mycoplasmopsis agassizii TaxID=33922 RepID=UPI0009D8B897|nr:Holliday junction DNA helicase subunit RuvB [Mycoplasmopsis agassizii]